MEKFTIQEWRDTLIDLVRGIADPIELQKLWLGEYKDRISSYTEEVEHFFTDYEIDRFLDHFAEQSGLNPQQLNALRQYRDAFRNYVDYAKQKYPDGPDPRAILEDPKWAEVTLLGKAFIESLGK